ncbi:MAG TPA: histidine phosphatase family protein [Candidatus Limnocylindrales bacterium]|jgi:phosphohistidine phosphatase SixA
MTELLLLRHAHAGDPMAWSGSDDVRPLSKKGRDQAARMAAFLVRVGVEPDRIVSSPKTRAIETARPVADALGLEVDVDQRLAEAFGLAEIERLLADLGDPERPMLVGHDPDFSSLVAALCHAPSVPVRKGALVRIDAPRPLCPGCGTLRWLVPPDLLPKA